jgi:hypothetical protein
MKSTMQISDEQLLKYFKEWDGTDYFIVFLGKKLKCRPSNLPSTVYAFIVKWSVGDWELQEAIEKIKRQKEKQ